MRPFTFLLALCAVVLFASAANAAPFADIIVVIDESGSMGGEHAFIGPAMVNLDGALIGLGITPNQFGLVGFGADALHGTPGHTHLVGGGLFGTSAQFSAATGGLVLTGATEDGYSGIAHALTYPFRAGSARNIILVTDEDRDNAGGPSRASILQSLDDNDATLNAIVNATFRSPSTGTQSALGIDSDGNAYFADGLGGFTTAPGGFVFSAFGNTDFDYIQLALLTGGAAWDLNQLRLGGLTAQSFTNAFVQIKAQEIREQGAVPEPSSIAVWCSLAALVGGVYFTRRRRQAA